MPILDIRRIALAASLSLCAAGAAAAQEAAPSGGAPAAVSAPPAAEQGAAAPAARAPRRNRDLLSAEEIAAATELDLYSVISRRQPTWLRVRGATSLNRSEQVMVHVDGAPAGGLGVLRQLKPTEVLEIRHMNGSEATQRYGTGYGAGVILVTRR